MKKIYRERLLALADFLAKLPGDRFFWGSWIGSNWEGDPDLSCGTTACALGWATTMTRFRRIGLSLKQTKYLNADIILVREGKKTLSASKDAYGIIDEVFGEYPGVRELFIPQWYENSKKAPYVVKKIRALVKSSLRASRAR